MLAVLSGIDLAVVIVLSVLILVALVLAGRVTLSFRGVKAVMERTAEHVETVKDAVGEKNGNGDVATMLARTLGELAEIRAEQTAVKQRLEDRTHVTRVGRTEPEDLVTYTQDRMHDILGAISLVGIKVDVLWRFLKDDYQLPDLPSVKEESK